GIHFDDYFYPSADEDIDSSMYKAYVNNTEEPLPLHEWRTANINALIASVYRKIKKVDENIVFGISPQGNLANNEKINADVYTWCAQKGYIDYICPQLYYSFENAALPFETALAEWTEMPRLENIELYIGLAVYKAGTDADDGTWLSREDTIARQIERAKESGADGIILYAVDHLGNDAAQAEMANAEIVIDAWIE
ncbi:MAG: family 10 glycosylhydrolase, partial [Clostridia bacterium]|nr:family 10 glycosylhydrolase [Clostridia bacterium]